MTVINLNNVEKSYGIDDVLKGFSFCINEGERVGLIGVNGSGKTTVLKIIAGIEDYSAGSLAIKKGMEVGYLSQMPDFNNQSTLYAELKSVFQSIIDIEAKLRVLEGQIAVCKDSSRLNKMMTEYSQLQHRFELNGAYLYETKINQVALGMGFSAEELKKPVSTLSGGEKTRLGLVKLLLSEPDLLLLDEPTNHLDLPSMQWLGDYLKEYEGAVVIISHDRYFLDEVVTRIVEIKDGKDEVYHGNYSYYLQESRLRYEQRYREYENQQKKIKKMEEAIKRLHQWGQQGDNGKFFKRAKSMQKALDKIVPLDRPSFNDEKIKLNLSVSNRSGHEVLKVNDIYKSFGKNVLFKNLNLNIYWGEKAAILGRNGSGKTTLIKIILDEIRPEKGQVIVGSNVKIGYYSQEFEGFNPDDDLISALRRDCSISTQEARDALAAFLFTEDEVFKKVGTLSGGEKSRLRLLQLMNGDYNFLILDEPTNHLDLLSREILEETLLNYPGTIFVVSHDRYFLNKFVNYIYELDNKTLTKYYGNYDYYRQKKEELGKVFEEKQKNKRISKKKIGYYKLKDQQREERKRKNYLEKLENKIEELEEEIEVIEGDMVNPDNFNDFNLLNELKIEYDKKSKKLTETYEKWEDQIERDR